MPWPRIYQWTVIDRAGVTFNTCRCKLSKFGYNCLCLLVLLVAFWRGCAAVFVFYRPALPLAITDVTEWSLLAAPLDSVNLIGSRLFFVLFILFSLRLEKVTVALHDSLSEIPSYNILHVVYIQ